MFSRLDILGVLGDSNAFALASTLWFGYVSLVLLSAAKGLEVTVAEVKA